MDENSFIILKIENFDQILNRIKVKLDNINNGIVSKRQIRTRFCRQHLCACSLARIWQPISRLTRVHAYDGVGRVAAD